MSWILLFSQPYVADLLLYPLEYRTQSTDIQTENVYTPTFVLPLACYYQTHTNNPKLSRWPECSLLRMLTAKSLAQQYDAKLVLTGGNFLRDKSVNYSNVASQFLLDQGLPKKTIVNLGIGKNTREELTALLFLVEKQPVVIVTSATHVYRVKALAQELGLNASVIGAHYISGGKLTPYITLPTARALIQSKSAFYEYIAILKYYFESNKL